MACLSITLASWLKRSARSTADLEVDNEEVSLERCRKNVILIIALTLLVLLLSNVAFAINQESEYIPVEIVQQVTDYPGLHEFLHPEIAGRVPLVLSSHLLPPKLELRKFGHPVHVRQDSGLRNGAFIRFRDYRVDAGKATVLLDYKVAGVSGRFLFTRTREGRWVLTDASIWEY